MKGIFSLSTGGHETCVALLRNGRVMLVEYEENWFDAGSDVALLSYSPSSIDRDGVIVYAE